MSLAMHGICKTFPTIDTDKNVIGYFLNGFDDCLTDDEHLLRLTEKVNQCSELVLVDGGANHFLELLNQCDMKNISIRPLPSYIVGDLDSIDPATREALTSRFSNLKIERFAKDKDFTDFEGAIEMTNAEKVAKLFLFNALGKRIDHELTTLKNLHRKSLYQKTVIFQANGETIYVLSAKQPCEWTQNQKFQFFPLFEKDIMVVIQNRKYRPEKGKPLCVVTLKGAPSETIRKLQQIFLLVPQPYPKVDQNGDGEQLFMIPPGKKTRIPTEIGQTVSLIPISGPARNVRTSGLQWNLDIQKFGKKVCGVSNRATEREITIEQTEGELLCILQRAKPIALKK